MNSSKKNFHSVLLMNLSHGLPVFVDHFDGDSTDLNAIGLAIIKAGFTGIRGCVVADRTVAWQGQLDTPEATIFIHLLEHAKLGFQMPPISHVLTTIRALYAPERGNK